ncbi:ribosomal RNA small subunit methyltransferase A, partial [Bartonella bovis]|uniref:ribosomal RNA small subunit methyltransferase A n=1 Tax=Bartonella bovis TaxID=155194 RepID=UPI002486A0A9
PGPGGLTRALLAKGATVIAIERDERFIPALLEIEKHYPKKLKVICNDAMQQNFSKLFEISPEKPRIIANLPYNIGTQLLLNWLLAEPWPPFYESMTLMFQREVAKRITAKPRSAHYGRLSVLTGWRTIAKIAFVVPPQAFTPVPQITSSVVHI